MYILSDRGTPIRSMWQNRQNQVILDRTKQRIGGCIMQIYTDTAQVQQAKNGIHVKKTIQKGVRKKKLKMIAIPETP
jgi:hypothetical protein